jgi:hypothetical protein
MQGRNPAGKQQRTVAQKEASKPAAAAAAAPLAAGEIS